MFGALKTTEEEVEGAIRSKLVVNLEGYDTM
jgi:hypothetical protein